MRNHIICYVQFLDKEQDNKDDDLDFRALENGFVS